MKSRPIQAAAGSPRSTTLAAAKRRAAKRAREGGGVIFIVAMTLAVLAALGAFALQSSALEIRSAGYERQSTQTHYLTEYGVLAVAQDVGPGTVDTWINLLRNQGTDACLSVPATGSITPMPGASNCKKLYQSELAAAWDTGTPALVPYSNSSPATPGSLGAIPENGDFYAELTEPANAPPPPGFDMKSGFCFKQLTVTAVGITQPQITGNPTALYAGEGLETARARVIAGPTQVGCR